MSEKINFIDELKQSYLDYSMSVITNRALPDARDGCKPIHRRILYAMIEGGYTWDKPYKKSAKIVGDVLGKYHPHGDSSIYDALVRMAQDFSMSMTLVDGQGNFGSIDGDSAASMRYTESRLAKIAKYLLQDYERNTVDMVHNYDNSLEIPSVLPVIFPHLLVNGATGIAVGMATSIPTHNLHEVIDATCAFIDNHNLTVDDLMEYIKGPDLPTGGIISDSNSIRELYKHGRGSVTVRGVLRIEDGQIIISEIPYHINKSKLIEQILDLVQSGEFQDISVVRDESNCDGIRVVVELKRNANAEIVCRNLYLKTQLQVNMHAYMLALDNGVPKQLNLIDILRIFVRFRDEVIVRRTEFFMANAKARTHILWGLILAISRLDEIIACIKSSTNAENARQNLMAMEWNQGAILANIDRTYIEHELVKTGDIINLSEAQVRSILEMRLQSLTGLEFGKLFNELKDLNSKIIDLQKLLDSQNARYELIKTEMLQVKNEFKCPRRSQIEAVSDTSDELSMVPKQECVVTISHRGYIKRVSLESYRIQRRGGRGKQGVLESDPSEHMVVANTHQELFLFTNQGKVYSIYTYKLPEAMPNTVGRALPNIMEFDPDEKIAAAMPVDFSIGEDLSLVFITSRGYVRRSALKDFESIRRNGKRAIKLNDNEDLVSVIIARADGEIMMTSSYGKSARISVGDLRIIKDRNSRGVIGMSLQDDRDFVVSVTLISEKNREEDSHILTVTAKGFGKRARVSEYRSTNRGAKGVTATIVSPKTGSVVGAYQVTDEDEILLMNNKGQIVRSPVNEIRIANRRTTGVHLARLGDDSYIVHVFVIRNCIPELEEVQQD